MTGAHPPRPILFAMTHSLAGGLREIWNDVADGLGARGHVVRRFVLYPPAQGHAMGDDVSDWHHLVEQRPRSLIAAVKMFVGLIRYVRAERPTAIVTAMPVANILVPLAVTLSGTDTRVFVSHHTPADTHSHMLDLIDGWTGSLGCVAAIISVSDTVGGSLDHKPAAYRAKRCTIHNALPERIERHLDALRRPPAQGDQHGARIIALGRLSAQKNYPLLLNAMAEVADATLEIVGAGEDEDALRALAVRLRIADRVRFVGLVTREEALALAADADIFVQVSRYEGHSLALIEAARLGLPLVVSDVPVQVEAITARDGTRCGIAAALDDPAALALRLRALLGDAAARAQWSQRARRIGDEASNAHMIECYDMLLAPSRAQR